MAQAFEEQVSPSKGRGLFATRALKAGSFAFQSQQPFVAVLDSPILTRACSWCFVFVEEASPDDEVAVSACTACKIVRYCGKACQTASWKHSHKFECKIFKALYPQVLPNTARMIIQVLLRQKNNAISKNDWDQFIKLQHHMDDLERGAREGRQDHVQALENIRLIGRAGKEYSSSSEQLGYIETLVGRVSRLRCFLAMLISLKLLTNTMTLTSSVFTPLGLTCSLTSSLLNHSCEPNSAIVCNGRGISLSIYEDIDASTELTISYINTTLSTEARGFELRTRYHFICQCGQCSQHCTLGHSEVDIATRVNLSSSEQLELAQKVSTLLVEAKSISAAEGLSQVTEAYAMVSNHPQYPAWLSPLYQVRLDFIIALQANRQWVAAFVQAMVLHFTALPIVYPSVTHPARTARSWVNAKMAGHVGGLANEPGFAQSVGAPEQSTLAQRLASAFNLDWGMVVYVLVKEVSDRVAQSHGPSSKFCMDVQREMSQIEEEARTSRGKPSKEDLGRTYSALADMAGKGGAWIISQSEASSPLQKLLPSSEIAKQEKKRSEVRG